MPYFFRHRFPYIGDNRQKEDGIDKALKEITYAMGHLLDFNLASYSRFMTKELAKNFDQEKVDVN